MPFGFRLGAFFFQKKSDDIHYIMQQKGYPYLQNYIDDLIYISSRFTAMCQQMCQASQIFLESYVTAS